MEKLTRWPTDHWFLTFIACVLFTIACGYGSRFLVFEKDYRAFFSEDNPQLMTYNRMQQTFSKTDNVLFVVAPKNGDIFTRDNLQLLEELTEAAWQLPYSTRVDSISNFQYTQSEEDDLLVGDLFYDSANMSDEEIARARHYALTEPALVSRVVSPSGHVTGVNATIHLPGKELDEVVEVVVKAREIRDELAVKYPDVKIYLTGITMLNNSFEETALNDVKTLLLAMSVLIMFLTAVFMRSIMATFATMIVVIASITIAVGLAGWGTMKMMGPSASSPVIIMTLAVADCIHILATLFYEMNRYGKGKKEALIASLRLNFQPIMLTSITTAVGFLSMNFSDAPPFRDLGNIVAFGVLAAFLMSLTLFPALLMVLPLKPPKVNTDSNSFLVNIADRVSKQPNRFLLGGLVFMLLMAAFIPQNQLEDAPTKNFDYRVDFRVATDFSENNLTGIHTIEFELASKSPDQQISNPQFLAEVAAFTDWLRMHPQVYHVATITDTLKRLNQNLHSDDPAYYRLPEARDEAAQYLLLYEMSLPNGLDLNNQINVNKSAIRMIVTLYDLPNTGILSMEEQTLSWLQENAPTIEPTTSSTSLMFSYLGERNIRSMLWATSIALLVICLLMGLALRSLKFGFISILPNLAPAIIAFGIWGIFVGEVGMAISASVGMTLGIVVDYSVHLLSKFLHARRNQNATVEQAIHYAYNSCGRALWVTTIVLVAGFILLAQSAFRINANVGAMTAITITVALLVDFIVLPALIAKLERDKETVSDAPEAVASS